MFRKGSFVISMSMGPWGLTLGLHSIFHLHLSAEETVKRNISFSPTCNSNVKLALVLKASMRRQGFKTYSP